MLFPGEGGELCGERVLLRHCWQQTRQVLVSGGGKGVQGGLFFCLVPLFSSILRYCNAINCVYYQ